MTDIYGFGLPTIPPDWLATLAASDLRLAVYGMRGLYGAVRFLHLIGMAVFVGMVVLLDLRGLGLFTAETIAPIRPRLGQVLSAAFWLTIATGLALFLYNPLGIGLHTMFLPKLLLTLAGYLHAKGRRLWPGTRRAHAIASLALWLLVIAASTWNHAERPANIRALSAAAMSGKP